MELLGLEDSSHVFQSVISLFFYVHLMFYTCVQRFDGMDEKILDGELNTA